MDILTEVWGAHGRVLTEIAAFLTFEVAVYKMFLRELEKCLGAKLPFWPA